MILRHVYNTPLAQASYLVGCAVTGEALIVDPNRDVQQYLDLAEREGLQITAITETHIHADFVSGARELGARTGAQLYLSDEGPADWKYAYADDSGAVLLKDGDTFMVGNVRIEAVHTPGHTPEHLSFLLTDTAGADKPMGIFTGDFVFVGDVGRPDLLEKAAGYAGTMEAGGRQLFQSLQRFRDLPDFVQIWPGHGAGSACGRALGAVPQTTVGYEKLFNWALQIDEEEQFVAAVLEGQPEPPVYFAEMKRINKEGPAPALDIPAPVSLPADSLTSHLSAGTVVVDARPADQFVSGFVRGTLHIPAGSPFVNWAGWLVPYDEPFALIADSAAVSDLARELQLIGLDNLMGYWMPDVLETRSQLVTIPRVSADEAIQMIGDGVPVLDVRGANEYAEGHVAGSIHIPLGYLRDNLANVLASEPLIVHCQSGVRSVIAMSILAANGRDNALDLVGGFEVIASGSALTADYDPKRSEAQVFAALT